TGLCRQTRVNACLEGKDKALHWALLDLRKVGRFMMTTHLRSSWPFVPSDSFHPPALCGLDDQSWKGDITKRITFTP
ncbi:hypothetical protein AVEN_179707-1, partial [Araneus ventricosus]